MLRDIRKLFDRDGPKSLEDALLEIASKIWQIEEKTRGQHYPPFEYVYAPDENARPELEIERERLVQHSFDHLLNRWPESELTTLAADMYFGSQTWWERYDWDYRRPEATRYLIPAQGRIISYLLNRWITMHPPLDLTARLRRHVERLHRDVRPGQNSYVQSDWYHPNMQETLDLLENQTGDDATALVHDILRGTFGVHIEPAYPVCYIHPRFYGTQVAFGFPIARALPWMLNRIWKAGLLTEDLLETAFQMHYTVLQAATENRTIATYGDLQAKAGPELADAVDNLTRRIIRRWADNLNEITALSFSQVGYIEGSWFLTRACRYIEELGIKRMQQNDYYSQERIEAAITRMCQVGRISENEEAVVADLRQFKESTLLLVLPVARAYQDLICRALGWDYAYDLVAVIRTLAHYDVVSEQGTPETRNSTDPAEGVVDPREIRNIYDRFGEKHFDAMIKALTSFSTDTKTKNALFLLQACVGRNTKKIIQGFAKRSQMSVRALGLLPYENGDELLRRYAALRQFAKEASQFGMQRQMNERAAVEAALTNLALNAGYSDSTRLEWAMEDQLGAGLGAGGREWKIDEQYSVRLEVGSSRPDLIAFKNGTALKTLPAVVKKHPDYGDMKEATTQLRGQGSRYRAALEDAMCREEALSPDEIATLSRHPLACGMLNRLLLADESGHIGLCHAQSMEIEEISGERHPIAGKKRIAHAYDLQQAGLLAQWQSWIVHHRIVQPFKQAFRELYVVTPAEEETRTFSRRFTGQVVDSARAARLLGSERWECVGEDWPRKVFSGAGITAHLSFVEYYHYMGEINSLEVNQVYFLPKSVPHVWLPDNDHRLPLREIPPIIFSEVMRDVDLVVSVAQFAGEAEQRQHYREPGIKYDDSAETMERRADLVRSLAGDLDYKNITVDGHFARVKGKLADYRVHLGSAAIHIEPGTYLCIVPAGWGFSHDRLFLPFDTVDQKTSEVVSKVLLLAEDDKIRDQSILSQIKKMNVG